MVEQHKNLYQRLLGRLQGRLQNESRASSPE
jgi:hypothetical protein